MTAIRQSHSSHYETRMKKAWNPFHEQVHSRNAISHIRFGDENIFSLPRPYSVTPPTATLAVNACIQATISFTPKQLGEHGGELLLCYDTGEKVYTKLYGSATDVGIRLDKSSVSVENTYIGLSSHR